MADQKPTRERIGSAPDVRSDRVAVLESVVRLNAVAMAPTSQFAHHFSSATQVCGRSRNRVDRPSPWGMSAC